MRAPLFGDLGSVRIAWAILPLGSIAYVRESIDGLDRTLYGPMPAARTGEFIVDRKREIEQTIASVSAEARQ